MEQLKKEGIRERCGNVRAIDSDVNSFSRSMRIFFENGYGVSVVDHAHIPAPFEIAVLRGNSDKYALAYDTEITDDVIRCENRREVFDIIERVCQLSTR